MTWAVLIVRLLLGAGFTAAAVAYFAGAGPKPPDDPPDAAKQFGTVLGTTHYMDVVKVIELAGGLLLLSGRLAPLGVVLLMPVAVNILLWDVLLVKKMGVGPIVVGLLLVVMYGYRRYFLPFFRPDAKIE